MESSDLNPGDKVVDLGALLRASAVFAGASAAGVSVWILDLGIVWTIAACFSGGAAGFLLGTIVGLVDYQGFAGLATVVKLGPGALAPALKAGLFGGVTTGVIAALIPPAVLSGTADPLGLVAIGVVTGALVGATFAYLATRP